MNNNKFFDKLPDTFIIFDTEFTAWEGSQERKWSGENEFRELVQISAIRVKKKVILSLLLKNLIYIFSLILILYLVNTSPT